MQSLVNFNLNKKTNAKCCNATVAVAPFNPKEGTIYYDSTDKR